ncbi:MAG: hypothetical protein U1A77_11750 [Pirellulales bacterium]
MFVELDREEMCLLQRLAESRISELHTEMRRVRGGELRKELDHEHEVIERILHQLHECECDVTA